MKDVLCKMLLAAHASQKGFYWTTMSRAKICMISQPTKTMYGERTTWQTCQKPYIQGAGIVASKSVVIRDES